MAIILSFNVSLLISAAAGVSSSGFSVRLFLSILSEEVRRPDWVGFSGFGGGMYDSFEGGGGINGLRTKD